jgi:sugar O-acyltransferase (sialic acid O-acetyltransferase NeuD family)
MRVIVFGGGDYGVAMIEIARAAGHTVEGIVDDTKLIGEHVWGDVKVLGGKEDLNGIRKDIPGALMAVGLIENHPRREEIYSDLMDVGFILPTVIHPSAWVSPSAKIGFGTYVLERAVVCTEAQIGQWSLVNCGTIISHHCELGRNVHVAGGTVLAGRVKVGSNTLIGMGCTVYLDVEIGSGVVITNGANVFVDVEDGVKTNRQRKGV